MSWTLLNSQTVEYDQAVELANQIAPTIANSDALFDEVSSLNRILQQISIEKLENQTPEQKWKKIFADDNFPCLLKLVDKIFSVPVSNSFIETVFSLAKFQWTDSRNSLLPSTVKALLQVKVNFDYSCAEMHVYLMWNPLLLKKIRGNEKYTLWLYNWLFYCFVLCYSLCSIINYIYDWIDLWVSFIVDNNHVYFIAYFIAYI